MKGHKSTATSAHCTAAEGVTTSLDGLPLDVERVLAYVARKRLLLPISLLLMTHRPLGFVAGQAMLAAVPLELLFPSLDLRTWATLLSEADGLQRIEAHLRELRLASVASPSSVRASRT